MSHVVNRRTFLAVACAACACAATGEFAPAAESGPIDAGPLSNFSSEGIHSPLVNEHRIFIVRNENKLYACSATCTHKRQKLKADGSEIACASHGSRFSIHGTVVKGPAKASLVRYGISTNADGHVIVDKSKSFAEKEWESAGAFIAV